MEDAGRHSSSRIFISYRREDSSGHVLALLPALRRRFGADRVVKDADNLPPGADFVNFIKRELESCSVLLAIIGRDWLTVQDPRLKRRRLENPDDSLRVEVSTALRDEHIRVIPVLVERATMPSIDDLPPDLAALSYCKAVELTDIRWESDVQLLIEAIERATPAAAPTHIPAQRPELLDLQKRRQREIAAHITSAREALETQDYEATLWACEKALLVDPQQSEALEMLDRARKAIDERKIAEWLAQAQVLLRKGDIGDSSDLIDQALSLDNTSEAALALRKEMLNYRRERERERERARAVRSAIERARSSLHDEHFDVALSYVDEALAVDPLAAEANEIRTEVLQRVRAARPLEDSVKCTVFAPPQVTRGGTILVQVFAHPPGDAQHVERLATTFDSEAVPRATRFLDRDVARGSQLAFQLTISGAIVDESVRSLTWRGTPECVQFGVTIPNHLDATSLVGTVVVSQDGVPFGDVKFLIRVVVAEESVTTGSGTGPQQRWKRYHQAFISYASPDRPEVLKRVQMLQRVSIEFFQDLLTLEPGERWARRLYKNIDESDVFFLFWSTAAKQSEWVMQEVRYAIQRKGGDEFADPEIVPVIIEGPPPVPPPPELQHLHFNDQIMYFIRVPTA